jgi:hypothetical protein
LGFHFAFWRESTARGWPLWKRSPDALPHPKPSELRHYGRVAVNGGAVSERMSVFTRAWCMFSTSTSALVFLSSENRRAS